MNLVHQKDFSTTRGQIVDHLDDHVKFLLGGDQLFLPADAGSLFSHFTHGFKQGMTSLFDPVTVNCQMRRDPPQKYDGRLDVLLRRLFQYLQTDILHHIARETTITKTTTQVIDKFIVMMDQYRDQRR